MSLSEYGQNHALDSILGNGSPTSVFIAVMFTVPTVGDDGSMLDEPSDSAYARVEVPNTTTEWPDATSGRKTNGVEILFAEATETWGRLDAFAVCFASVDGQVMGFGALNTGVKIRTGDQARFAVDTLVVTAE